MEGKSWPVRARAAASRPQTRVRRWIAGLDTRGLILPRIDAGEVGANARAIGAACCPILEQYQLNGLVAPAAFAAAVEGML